MNNLVGQHLFLQVQIKLKFSSPANAGRRGKNKQLLIAIVVRSLILLIVLVCEKILLYTLISYSFATGLAQVHAYQIINSKADTSKITKNI